ncbi:MAG: hypothetical protein JO283_17265 [Bradyrhizobium sp.]|nr:hypothetical protein [Bradyrhizobium sp.]
MASSITFARGREALPSAVLPEALSCLTADCDEFDEHPKKLAFGGDRCASGNDALPSILEVCVEALALLSAGAERSEKYRRFATAFSCCA